MDIKVECVPINLLCYGCLSTDRKLRRVRGEFRKMFHVLRNDEKYDEQSRELLLCWECMAFLRKLKMFQARIRKAECLLVTYFQNYYNKDAYKTPHKLSTLITKHIPTYTCEFNEEEKTFDETVNNVNCELKDNEKKIEEELLTDIKTECNENIKEEFDYCVSNASDYCDTEFKCEKEDGMENTSRVKKKSVKKYKNKRYEKYATITCHKKVLTYLQCTEEICLSQKEYENVLKREKKHYNYFKLKHKCDKCDEDYIREQDLTRHKIFCHNEKSTFPYKCEVCTTMITSLEHLNEHWTMIHTKMIKCLLCSEVYHSEEEIKKHIKRQHSKNYNCNQCRLDFGSLPKFRKHYRQMHAKVICDYCNVSFIKKKTLLIHITRQHIPAFCKLCNRVYRNQKSLNSHNMVTHPELITGETSKELSYCVECDRQYPSVYKYHRHLQESPRHTPQKKIRVPCPECGKIFSRTNFMRNHYRLVHLKVTKNYCEQCDKYYATGYGLRQHIARFHKKIAQPKDKFCDLCGRGFGTNKILENHRRTHTGERPYKCKYCPAAFAQQTAMKTHQKSQHKNMELSS